MAKQTHAVLDFLTDLEERLHRSCSRSGQTRQEQERRTGEQAPSTSPTGVTTPTRLCRSSIKSIRLTWPPISPRRRAGRDVQDLRRVGRRSICGATDAIVSAWHEDAQPFDIIDPSSGEAVARFYMDLYPRPGKFGHAAAFTLRGGRRLGDDYQRPISSIVANFTKPTESSPSLLRHTEVVTLFHESDTFCIRR